MNGTAEKYLTFTFDEDQTYVKRNKAELLKDIDAVVFDCDGVLIDIRGSYDRAISETVVYILEGFTGCGLPRDLISNEVIFLFRKSGGFNNDWDTCYGVLMFILCNLPEDFQGIFGSVVKRIDKDEKPLQRFLQVKSAIGEVDLCALLEDEVIDELMSELARFTGSLDESGILSVDRNLRNQELVKDYYEDLRYLLLCPCKVGGGIIPTVFEEIFCGSSLVKEIYGVDPAFYNGRGRIENEQVIISGETLDRLPLTLGKRDLGIASGSRFKSAEKVLGRILRCFKPQALVFLDDVEREEKRILKETGCTVNLKKPEAFSLLKSAEGLEPFGAVLYVGDSMEDALTVEKALGVDPRFIFAGVYSYSGSKVALLKSFLQAGVDVILPSVNEIPLLLEELRR
ncbi:MAG: hypothetical protein OEZ48_11080 [Candidatus Bathyarchaeota archaeon]|nr:hypothetical protein [Candidatus Bathyarchaeota archaeon]MDH5688387.1 hypothetical protein [Candidatus Bathyarchaeota archaeon]